MKVKSGYTKTMMHILINERMRVFLFRELKFLPQLLLPLEVWGKDGGHGLRDTLFIEFRRELKLDKEGLCSNGTRFGCQEDERKNWTEYFYNTTPWYYYLMAAVCVGKIYFKDEKDQSSNKSLKDIAILSSAYAKTLETEGEKYLIKIWNKLWADATKPIHDLWEKLEAKGEIYGGYDQIIDNCVYFTAWQLKSEQSLLWSTRHYSVKIADSIDGGVKNTKIGVYPFANKLGYQNYLPMSFIRFAPQLSAPPTHDALTTGHRTAVQNYFTHAFPDLVLWGDHTQYDWAATGPEEEAKRRLYPIKDLTSVKYLTSWSKKSKNNGAGWHPTKIADFALSLGQGNIPHKGLKSDQFHEKKVLELSPAFYNSDSTAETLTPEALFYALTRGRSSDPKSLKKFGVMWPKDGIPLKKKGKDTKYYYNHISDAQNNIDPLSSFHLYARRRNDAMKRPFVGGHEPEGRWDRTAFAHQQKPYNLWEPVSKSHRGIDTSATSAHEMTFNAVSHIFNRYLTTVPGTFIKFLDTNIDYSISFGEGKGDSMQWTLPAREQDIEGLNRDHGYLQTPTGGPSRDKTFFWQNAPGAFKWTNILHPENEIDAALANTIHGAGWVEPAMATAPTTPAPPPEKCETDFLS